MRGEMLHRREDTPLALEGALALKASHRGEGHWREEVWSLAEGLFDATPSRIARDVHHRRERVVGAARPCLFGGHREQPLDELGVERRREADWLREAGSLRRRLSVETLLV